LLSPFLYILLITQASIIRYPTNVKPTEEFCLDGYFPFPQGYKIQSSFSIKVDIKEKTTIFSNLDIFAKKICITPLELIPELKQYDFKISFLDILNLNILPKNISVSTELYPQINGVKFGEEINRDQILEYTLTSPSNILDYYIKQGDLDAKCTVESSSLKCDLSLLTLQQGQEYELILLSKYHGQIVRQLGTRTVKTHTAVMVEQSSITNNSILQNTSVAQIDITLNKEVENRYQITLADSSGNNIKYESSVLGKILSIYPKENFKQDTSYLLKINGLTGLDGSQMENEYVLNFSIDDGPKITSTNIGSGFSTSGNIIFTFNQNLLTTQNIKTYIKLNSATNYSYSIRGNQITINPDTDLSFCQKYTVSLNKGLTSNTGLIASTGASYTLKTTCKRTITIGTSVQGRSIYAYYFGSGANKIVFFGSIHGSEANTRTLMNRWATELENNSDRIPADKTIIVIPSVNPDGIANRSRFNANGVDLNRNFDTPSWVTGTYLQTDFYPTGGGSAPFSEPESQDIRDLMYREHPYLTLTYHAAAGYVIPTNSSNAISFGNTYSQLSGYRYVTPGDEGSFTYDITGTFEEWAEGHGYNALVIELSSYSYDQFTQNSKAMWRMVEQ